MLNCLSHLCVLYVEEFRYVTQMCTYVVVLHLQTNDIVSTALGKLKKLVFILNHKPCRESLLLILQYYSQIFAPVIVILKYRIAGKFGRDKVW